MSMLHDARPSKQVVIRLQATAHTPDGIILEWLINHSILNGKAELKRLARIVYGAEVYSARDGKPEEIRQMAITSMGELLFFAYQMGQKYVPDMVLAFSLSPKIQGEVRSGYQPTLDRTNPNLGHNLEYSEAMAGRVELSGNNYVDDDRNDQSTLVPPDKLDKDYSFEEYSSDGVGLF